MEAWIDKQIAFYIRHWVVMSSILSLAVVGGAVAIPLLAAGGFDMLAWIGYKIYRLMCPQQPSHSWYIAGEKMGFEHRETAMFLAAAVAGPLYVVLNRLGFKRLPGKLALLLLIPMLYDVFSQIVGIRDSTGFWRSVTGALAVFAVAGWFYPLVDADFQKALATIDRKQARRRREALAANAESVAAD